MKMIASFSSICKYLPDFLVLASSILAPPSVFGDLPFRVLSIPFNHINKPLCNTDIPFRILNIPRYHINKPQCNIDIPFRVFNIPRYHIDIPLYHINKPQCSIGIPLRKEVGNLREVVVRTR